VKISRNLSGRIGWALDNLLPPVLRDSAWFMRPAMWLLFRDKTDNFMRFKERAPLLDRNELLDYYRTTAEVHLDRSTDLTPQIIERILCDLIGERILDIACGKGFLSAEIARRTGKNVTGMDFIAPAQSFEQRLCFRQGAIEKIDCADNSFDTVVSAHTLEHVVDIERAIAELRRVARQRLIVVVPRQRNYRYTFDLHIRFFQYPHDLQLLMKNSQGKVCLLGNDLYYCEDL